MQALTLTRFEKKGLDGIALQEQLVPQPQALGYGPRIAETFALNEAKSALERFASGKAKGKVVVVI